MKIAMMAILFVASISHAHSNQVESFTNKPILADLKDLRALNIPVLAHDEYAQVGYTVVDPKTQQKIQEYAHAHGKCGGFEDLSQEKFLSSQGFQAALGHLADLKKKNEIFERAPFRIYTAQKDAALDSAISEINADNMKATVQWLSAYKTRNGKSTTPNVHVVEMKTRLEAMLQNSKVPYEVSLIEHNSTNQKTVRVRILGSERPNEVVVLGGHLDSVNMSWAGGATAPGADDNASGSANLVEALRIVSQKTQPKRTIDFFWYAGEESGLLGSAEVAKQYKASKTDVIGVLQLDMTLFPGSGELVIGSMTDFTSAWLRDYLKAMNETYIHARIVEDQCGYGCSDHASWYRQGYPTVMPFEAKMDDMNSNIHSANDVVGSDSNFNHSLAYTKIALVFAMDLANSSIRQPY